MYHTDPINYGKEVVEIKRKIGSIEHILNEILQNLSVKAELNQPHSQLPNTLVTDEDLQSIFNFCAS